MAILSANHAFSFKKMHFKMSYATLRQLCLGVNVHPLACNCERDISSCDTRSIAWASMQIYHEGNMERLLKLYTAWIFSGFVPLSNKWFNKNAPKLTYLTSLDTLKRHNSLRYSSEHKTLHVFLDFSLSPAKITCLLIFVESKFLGI